MRRRRRREERKVAERGGEGRKGKGEERKHIIGDKVGEGRGAERHTSSALAKASSVNSNTAGPGLSVSESRYPRISSESRHRPRLLHPARALQHMRGEDREGEDSREISKSCAVHCRSLDERARLAEHALSSTMHSSLSPSSGDPGPTWCKPPHHRACSRWSALSKRKHQEGAPMPPPRSSP